MRIIIRFSRGFRIFIILSLRKLSMYTLLIDVHVFLSHTVLKAFKHLVHERDVCARLVDARFASCAHYIERFID